MRTDSPYLNWLGPQLAAGAPDVRRADGRFGPDLVMGYATGYGVGALAPFVRSLRAFFDGRVALYVNDGDPGLDAFLHRHGVDRLSPPRTRGWRPVVAVSRFGSYLAALQAYPDVRRVLLTDVRDVVFQGPPLADPVDALEFYPEHGEDSLAEDCKNLRWLRRMFGRAVGDQLAGRTCLCAGTIIGTRAEIERLCRILLFLGAIPRSGVAGAFGADQAAYNLAVYHRIVSGTQHANFGRVATLQRTPSAELSWNGRQMVNPDGTVSPIVHKYDRHPHIEAQVRRLWAADLSEPAKSRRRLSLSRFLQHAGGGLAKRIPELR